MFEKCSTIMISYYEPIEVVKDGLRRLMSRELDGGVIRFRRRYVTLSGRGL